MLAITRFDIRYLPHASSIDSADDIFSFACSASSALILGIIDPHSAEFRPPTIEGCIAEAVRHSTFTGTRLERGDVGQ